MLPPPDPNGAALVTGASSGLGLALAHALSRRGHNVILTARRALRLRALADELATKHSVRAEVAPCDLTDRSASDELLRRVGELGLDIEILVNNAGLYSFGRFQEADVDVELDIVRVKVDSTVALTGHLLPAMVRRGRGAVLNIASTTAFQPLPRNATYAAANTFLLSFTEALHGDLAGTGVSATVLCPGPMTTELAESAGGAAATAIGRIPSLFWSAPDAVAEEAIAGVQAGKRVLVPGLINRAGALGGQYAPRGIVLRLAAAVSDVAVRG